MRWMAVLVCCSLGFSVLACAQSQALAVAPAASGLKSKAQTTPAPIRQVSPREAHRFMATQPGAQFIDVRQPEEYAQGHARGAVLRPLGELSSWVGTLKQEQPVVLICRSGNRSQIAAEALQKRGFKTLLNIQGGTPAWADDALPMAE